MKVLVIGLDGASFELLDPWIGQGDLPVLQMLKQKGIRADMDCGLPPTTSPNWKRYSTGKNPGKLGIYWWENINMEKGEVYFPRTRVNKHREIWDYIGESGRKVAVINMPLTFPPKKVNGFLVSGSTDAGEGPYTYPPELQSYIGKKYNYRLIPASRGYLRSHPGDVYKVRQAVDDIIEVIQSRFDLAAELLTNENIDFLHITIFDINTLHHFFWNSDHVKRAWQLIDRNIEKLLDKGDYLFLMSDHGSNEIKQVFNINAWLEREGYLKLNRSFSDFLYRFGVNVNLAAKVTQFFGIKYLLKRLVPKRFIQLIPEGDGSIGGTALGVGESKTRKINWRKTRAIASGQGPVYIHPRLPEWERERLKQELIQKLERLKSPVTGEPVVRRVYRKEEIYTGQYLAEMPDLVLDMNRGVHVPDNIGRKEVFELPRHWRGENKRFGLFLACGPGIRQGSRVEGVSIHDLAPTILHLFDIPSAADMDGRILKDIFVDDSLKKAECGDVNKTKMEKERIKNSLKALNFK